MSFLPLSTVMFFCNLYNLSIWKTDSASSKNQPADHAPNSPTWQRLGKLFSYLSVWKTFSFSERKRKRKKKEINTFCDEIDPLCISIYMENVFDFFKYTCCENSIYLYGKRILFLRPACVFDLHSYLYGKQIWLLKAAPKPLKSLYSLTL